MEIYDLIVIGAGVSGLMAAIEGKSRGIEKVIVIEREDEPGGALNCCVHNGFYYKNIKENLTIPELIHKLTEEAITLGVKISCNTTVLKIKNDKELHIINSEEGIKTIKGRAIILATGSRERPFGYKNILGYGALAGIVTSCATLNYINKQGVLPGKRCIVLGSDDIGMLAAKTLYLEGATVKYIVETSNSIRAREEASKEVIDDFNLKVLFNHRVVKVYGTSRVTGVDIVKLDENFNIIKGSKEYVDCDTLVLCMQLKPDATLAEKYNIDINEETDGVIVDSSFQTSIKGIYACGTVIDGYNTVESSMRSGQQAGKSVANLLVKK